MLDLSKIPPQAIDIEEAILGVFIMLANEDNVKHFIRIVKPEYFYLESHRIICQAIVNLHENKFGIDILTVANELRKMGLIEAMGGPFYLSKVTNRVALDTHLNYHFRILYQKYLQRKIIELSTIYSNKAYDESNDPFDVISDFNDEMRELNKINEIESTSHSIHKAIDSTFSQIFLTAKGEITSCFKTSMVKTDDILALNPGIMLVSGAGGIGKTSFITMLMHKLLKHNRDDVSIYWNAIDHDDHKVIMRKMMSQLTGINERKMLSKGTNISQDELNMLVAIRESISQYDIIFNEEPSTVKQIGAMFTDFCQKRKHRKMNICLIDNVMRLKENRSKDIKNQNSIDDLIANSIADLRKDTDKYNSLIIYLHHMTKEQSSEYNMESGYRPTIDHIKGSGRFTDVPEQILLLNRPGNYPKLLLQYPEQKDILQHLFIVDIAKNSLGPTGTLHYFCNMATSYFEEI